MSLLRRKLTFWSSYVLNSVPVALQFVGPWLLVTVKHGNTDGLYHGYAVDVF